MTLSPEDREPVAAADPNAKLRSAVALRLGRMVMEYSRLETELGLALFGTARGDEAQAMTLALRRADFSERLRMLRRHLDAHPRADARYAAWSREADAARRLRNQLIHGRWDFRDPSGQAVTLLRGDPFSAEQTEVETSIGQLDGQLEQLRALRRRLAALRKSAPL
jgi:hypothetical protein